MALGGALLTSIIVTFVIGGVLTIAAIAIWFSCSGGCSRIALQRNGVTIPAEMTMCRVDDGWTWQGKEYTGKWTASSAGGIRNNILHQAFLDATQQLGIPVTIDTSDPDIALPASAVTSCSIDAAVIVMTLGATACIFVSAYNMGLGLDQPLLILLGLLPLAVFLALGMPWGRLFHSREFRTPSAQPSTAMDVAQVSTSAQGRLVVEASPTTMVHAMKATNLAAVAPIAGMVSPQPSADSFEEPLQRMPEQGQWKAAVP